MPSSDSGESSTSSGADVDDRVAEARVLVHDGDPGSMSSIDSMARLHSADVPDVPDGIRRTRPARPCTPDSRPARGLAGGTPIGGLGFRSGWRGCQKRRKSRRLEDGPETVKRGPARLARPTCWLALLACARARRGRVRPSPRPSPLRVRHERRLRARSAARRARAREPEGFDVELLRAYAAERGRELEFVRFRWPELLADLAAGRFDVAMSGVTVLPERSAAGRFSVPVAETEAFALARDGAGERAQRSTAPQVRIAVNAGGHLEQVARASFPHATLVAVPDNEAVIELLIAGARRRGGDGQRGGAGLGGARRSAARADRSAHARSQGVARARRPARAGGRSRRLAARARSRRHAGEAARPVARSRPTSVQTAQPLRALLAALDERLALMPLVGVVKRRDGVALVVPEREALVIEHALADLRAEAERSGRAAPDEARARVIRGPVRGRAQVQWRAVKDPNYHPPEPLPDLERELRPALLRIGERTARLLLALPAGLDRPRRARAAREELRAPYLDAAQRDALADAIAACTVVPAGAAPAEAARPACRSAALTRHRGLSDPARPRRLHPDPERLRARAPAGVALNLDPSVAATHRFHCR